MPRSILLRWSITVAGVCLLGVGLYFVPAVNTRVAWRLAALYTQVHYFFKPPDRQVFIPHEQQSTSLSPPTISPTPTATTIGDEPGPTGTPLKVDTPTPLPERVELTGIRYEWQSFNNCGPANLAMALSFWDWDGDQRITMAALRSNADDANVMPDELAAYVNQQPGLKATLRVGGTVSRLKSLLAAGYPVLIEMGHQPQKDWWMGHYLLINGYDDTRGIFITQDSLVMADLPLPYTEIEERWWRDFNYLYLVIYPEEREAQIATLLESDAHPQESHRRALVRAIDESEILKGRDQFFALYNQADLVLTQGDAIAAAQLYDRAFEIYASISEEDRPWRTFWYRTGPYQAYYESGRYQDVIDLANSVLSMLNKRGLEESHYWRGLAYEALGESDKAIFDYKIALQLRPDFLPCQEGLRRLGVD